MPSTPETGRTTWTDSFEFRIAKALGLVNPGEVTCLKCLESFMSDDIVYNRICPRCERLNYEILKHENCEDDFVYLEDPDTDLESLSFL